MRLNYIGSKKKLSKWIIGKIKENTNQWDIEVTDLFAGSGAMSRALKENGYYATANDLETYSFLINKAILYASKEDIETANSLIKDLNSLDGEEGMITRIYSPKYTDRKYFTIDNAMKIDAIRGHIDFLRAMDRINYEVYHLLIASLLFAADKVANVASVYAAYLKSFKKSALNPLKLEPLEYIEGKKGIAYKEDANVLVKVITGDILYLDPPYNHRQYGSNYFLLNIIAEYKVIFPQGVTGLPKTYNKSKYCSKVKALDSFKELILHGSKNFKDIFMSYNNEGILPETEIIKVLSSFGRVQRFEKEYPRFNSQNKDKKKITEYLYHLKVDEKKVNDAFKLTENVA